MGIRPVYHKIKQIPVTKTAFLQSKEADIA